MSHHAGGGSTWLLGRDLTETTELAAALDAEVIEVPADPPSAPADPWGWSWTEHLADWGRSVRTLAPRDRVVICAWGAPAEPVPFAEQSATLWSMAAEWELALWFEAAVAGTQICSDGGAVVVVTERPAALDSVGHADIVMVAEGLVTLARSLGICEGDRRVRVNAVLTELSTAPEVLLGLPPLLSTFPGTVTGEVAGAVRMLLSQDATGVTGTAVRADCGRSW